MQAKTPLKQVYDRLSELLKVGAYVTGIFLGKFQRYGIFYCFLIVADSNRFPIKPVSEKLEYPLRMIVRFRSTIEYFVSNTLGTNFFSSFLITFHCPFLCTRYRNNVTFQNQSSPSDYVPTKNR